MLKKLILPLVILIAVSGAFAQADLKKWAGVDYSKRLLKKTDLENFELDDLQMMRGIVFGKHGRVW